MTHVETVPMLTAQIASQLGCFPLSCWRSYLAQPPNQAQVNQVLLHISVHLHILPTTTARLAFLMSPVMCFMLNVHMCYAFQHEVSMHQLFAIMRHSVIDA